MRQLLIIDPEKCTGCRLCEVLCSFFKEGECNPALSRIKVMTWKKSGIPVVYEPRTKKCDLCAGDPKCVRFCETKALQCVPATPDNIRKKKFFAKKTSRLLEALSR